MKIEVGTVFRWNNFPDNRYGDGEKARWFICVGFTGIYSQTALIYSYTTTTQLHNFEPGGKRDKNVYFIFKACEHPCFEQDCAIDFNESPYSIERAKLDRYSSDIDNKGTLREETMRMIYNKTIASRYTSLMVKKDIHTSYNLSGIIGLPIPRK